MKITNSKRIFIVFIIMAITIAFSVVAISDETQLKKSIDWHKAGASFSTGVVRELNGEYEEAIKFYKEAVKFDDKFLEASANLSRTYYKQGSRYFYKEKYSEAVENYTQAIKHYTPALKRVPEATYYLRRRDAYLKQEKGEEGLKDYFDALYLEPENADYYNDQGDADFKQNEYKEHQHIQKMKKKQ